ncbi:MAG: ABC transporter ATP-binding protein, partial [Mesorhizobium sp.]
MKTPAIVDVVRAVLSHVSSQRRRQFIPVLGLMLAGALAELVSIGAVLPFLAVIADPERVLSAGRVQPLLGTVGINTSTEIVVAAASAFALAAVVAALVRLLLVYFSQQFVYGVAKELSVAVYSRTLHQPYEFHTGLNSSETIAAINKAQLVTNQLLLPLMTVATASVIATFILAGLVFIDPITAVTSGFGFGVIYLLVMRATRTVMRRNGVVIASAQSRRVQAVGEGLGGIRDVLLDRSQAIFIARFNEIESRLRSAQATSGFIAQLPRYVVEGLGVVLIAVLALALSTREGGLLAALP